MLLGHVHRRRELATVAFLIIRDRSGLAQVVVRAAELPTDGLPPEETVVRVTGTVAANPQAPGGVEIVDPQIESLSEPAAPPVVELWRPTLETSLPTLLDHAAVTWRHPARRATWQIAAASVRAFRRVLDAADFTEVQTPKIVDTVTESGANVFPVDYFGRTGYLAQSPQFYKQQLVGVFERVHEVGPVFRPSPTTPCGICRSTCRWTSSSGSSATTATSCDSSATCCEACSTASAPTQRKSSRCSTRRSRHPEDIPVVHFRDALRRVGAPADEPDLSPAHERALGAWAKEEFGSDMLAVEGYPMRKRPFYTHPQPDDTEWSNSFDLLFRGLELVTGGQRLHRHSEVVAAIEARGESPSRYAGYLEAFAHGMPPHGGFAIGLERWVGRLVEAANVREVTLFPRDVHRLTP